MTVPSEQRITAEYLPSQSPNRNPSDLNDVIGYLMATQRYAMETRGIERELKLAPDIPIAEVFRKKYGMRAGSVTGAGNFIPPYTPPDENGQSAITPYGGAVSAFSQSKRTWLA